MVLRVGVICGLHHYADDRLGAARTKEHAAGASHRLFGCLDSRLDGFVAEHSLLVRHAHVNELLWVLRVQECRIVDGHTGTLHCSKELDCGHEAIAR